MNFEIDKDVLKDELETISTALGGNDTEPIASQFLFRVTEDACEVMAGGKSNLVGYLKIDGLTPNLDGKDEVKFTVNGHNLMGFLGDVDDGALSISYDADTHKVNIVPVNGTDFNVVGMDPDGFPDFETDFAKAKTDGAKGTMKQEALEDAIGFTTQFIGENLSNPGFSLCRLKDDGTVTAGDGKSVAIYKRDDFGGEFKLPGPKNLGKVAAFIKGCEGDLSLYEGDNYYFFENDKGSYYGSSKVSFDFPTMKVPNLFEEVGDHIFTVDTPVLRGALNRLRWSLDNDLVRMGFKLGAVKKGDNKGDLKTKMVVSAKNSMGTISEEEVEVVRNEGNDETTFYLNYKYVLKGVEKFTGDTVTFYLNLKGTPFIKILEKVDDGGTDVYRVLFLSLMKRDR